MKLRRDMGRGLRLALMLGLTVWCVTAYARKGQEDEHGRRYKPPPATSHIVVEVVKAFDQKPIMNAAVIFNPVKDGKDEGNLELKTDPDGKATIDIIPTGSKVTVQVIADGFATFGQAYQVDEASRTIKVKLERPRAQVSQFVDEEGKPSQMQPGTQEPIRPKPAKSAKAAAKTAAKAGTGSSANAPAASSDSGSSSSGSGSGGKAQ